MVIKHYFKLLIAFTIFLHCTGATQFVSAYSKDKSAFIGMLSMTEEETKKEKEAKEDFDDTKHYKTRHLFSPVSFHPRDSRLYLSESKLRITNQFVSDNPSPPPDLQG